jgi:hypothetical protein
MVVTGAQLKSGRLAIGLSRQRLAGQAACSWQTVATYEVRGNTPLPETAILNRLVEVLESKGIEFRPDGVFVQRGIPLDRTFVHGEAVA